MQLNIHMDNFALKLYSLGGRVASFAHHYDDVTKEWPLPHGSPRGSRWGCIITKCTNLGPILQEKGGNLPFNQAKFA